MEIEHREGAPSRAPSSRDSNRVLESVRARLARDLHDNVGQPLNALLIRVRLAIAQGEAGMEELTRLELTAQQALAGARAVAYGLRESGKPDPLTGAREYAQRILSDVGCSMFWVDERTDAPLDSTVGKEVALAIQESATNIARHASAKAAWIGLEDENGTLRVTIRDDGVGFLPEAVDLTPDGRGLGLLGNAERLAAVGGSFDVESTVGGGTVVVLEAPLEGTSSRRLSERRLAPVLDIPLPEPSIAALPEPSVAATG